MDNEAARILMRIHRLNFHISECDEDYACEPVWACAPNCPDKYKEVLLHDLAMNVASKETLTYVAVHLALENGRTEK